MNLQEAINQTNQWSFTPGSTYTLRTYGHKNDHIEITLTCPVPDVRPPHHNIHLWRTTKLDKPLTQLTPQDIDQAIQQITKIFVEHEKAEWLKKSGKRVETVHSQIGTITEGYKKA